MSQADTKQKDWSAAQYLKFSLERTRPVHDLIAQITPHLNHTNKSTIYDLGSGPGNSTSALLSAFPDAKITGLDSSKDMLTKARAQFSNNPNITFIEGDISTFAPSTDTTPDLIFSNAAFHWLRSPIRITAISRLFTSLQPNSVLAFQVPDNYHEPSHTLMRTVASTPDAPWAAYFADTKIGDLDDPTRPDLDPIEPPSAFYNALIDHAQDVNIWRTSYQHGLADARAIVEWVRGTGLQPYLNRIEDEDAKSAFLNEYEARIQAAYPELADGRVLLAYPRLFVVAVRK